MTDRSDERRPPLFFFFLSLSPSSSPHGESGGWVLPTLTTRTAFPFIPTLLCTDGGASPPRSTTPATVPSRRATLGRVFLFFHASPPLWWIGLEFSSRVSQYPGNREVLSHTAASKATRARTGIPTLALAPPNSDPNREATVEQSATAWPSLPGSRARR